MYLCRYFRYLYSTWVFFFFDNYFYSLHLNTNTWTVYCNILCYLSVIFIAFPTHNAGIWRSGNETQQSTIFPACLGTARANRTESTFNLWVLGVSSFALNKLFELPSSTCGGWEEEETRRPRGHGWHLSALGSLNAVHTPFKHVFLLLNLSSAHVVRKASLPYYYIYWYVVFQRLKLVLGRVWRATFLHCL